MAYVLVDDLTDERIADPAVHMPTQIVVDGHGVEIDLTHASQETLRALLEPYFRAGRVPGGAQAAGIPASPDPAGIVVKDRPVEPLVEPSTDALGDDPIDEEPTDAQVRAWARRNHIDCPASRRVDPEVRVAYIACDGRSPAQVSSSS